MRPLVLSHATQDSMKHKGRHKKKPIIERAMETLSLLNELHLLTSDEEGEAAEPRVTDVTEVRVKRDHPDTEDTQPSKRRKHHTPTPPPVVATPDPGTALALIAEGQLAPWQELPLPTTLDTQAVVSQCLEMMVKMSRELTEAKVEAARVEERSITIKLEERLKYQAMEQKLCKEAYETRIHTLEAQLTTKRELPSSAVDTVNLDAEEGTGGGISSGASVSDNVLRRPSGYTLLDYASAPHLHSAVQAKVFDEPIQRLLYLYNQTTLVVPLSGFYTLGTVLRAIYIAGPHADLVRGALPGLMAAPIYLRTNCVRSPTNTEGFLLYPDLRSPEINAQNLAHIYQSMRVCILLDDKLEADNAAELKAGHAGAGLGGEEDESSLSEEGEVMASAAIRLLRKQQQLQKKGKGKGSGGSDGVAGRIMTYDFSHTDHEWKKERAKKKYMPSMKSIAYIGVLPLPPAPFLSTFTLPFFKPLSSKSKPCAFCGLGYKLNNTSKSDSHMTKKCQCPPLCARQHAVPIIRRYNEVHSGKPEQIELEVRRNGLANYLVYVKSQLTSLDAIQRQYLKRKDATYWALYRSFPLPPLHAGNRTPSFQAISIDAMGEPYSEIEWETLHFDSHDRCDRDQVLAEYGKLHTTNVRQLTQRLEELTCPPSHFCQAVYGHVVTVASVFSSERWSSDAYLYASSLPLVERQRDKYRERVLASQPAPQCQFAPGYYDYYSNTYDQDAIVTYSQAG